MLGSYERIFSYKYHTSSKPVRLVVDRQAWLLSQHVSEPFVHSAETILAFARLAEFEDRPDAFNDMAWQWSKDTDEQK